MLIILGYTDNVFRGIIKGIRVNGELVTLSGRKMVGNAEVVDCDSNKAQEFAKELTTFEDDGTIIHVLVVTRALHGRGWETLPL